MRLGRELEFERDGTGKDGGEFRVGITVGVGAGKSCGGMGLESGLGKAGVQTGVEVGFEIRQGRVGIGIRVVKI